MLLVCCNPVQPEQHTPLVDRAWRRNAAVIKATTHPEDYAAQADGAASDSAAETPRDAAGAPLLGGAIPKKAGLRTHGVLFLNTAKTWWAGLFLVVLSGVVLVITLLTAGGGAEH